MFSINISDWIRIEICDKSSLDVHIAPKGLVLIILSLMFTLLGTIGLNMIGFDFTVLRAVLAFLFLTFVPGFLLARIIGIEPRLKPEFFVYVVGISLAFLMGIGVFLNAFLYFLGVSRPLDELPLVLSISFITLLLIGIYYGISPSHERKIRLDCSYFRSPMFLSLALLPPMAIYGAIALTRYDNNILLLILYFAIATVPLLVIYNAFPRSMFSFGIWAIGLALLLQNTLTGQFLTWGDQTNEAALVLHVLTEGHWNPVSAPRNPNKFTMLRIVILHPIYARFSGLQVAWLFKIIHPLLFSAMPVSLYLAYRRNTDYSSAFLSTFLYISLFSFFLVLSRNTRTGTALLFLSFLLLVILDDKLAQPRRKLLAIIFATSVIVSHYGVSYIFMFALILILPLKHIFARLSGTNGKHSTITSPAFVILYAITALAWYIYVSPGSQSYELLLNFVTDFYLSIRSEFLVDPGSTSATTRYVTGSFDSVMIRILTFYNLIIGSIIILGLSSTVWRIYSNSDNPEFNIEYLAYAVIFLGVFSITFLPVERFNTARTYATSLLFFAPFFVIGIRDVLQIGNSVIRRVKRKNLPTREVAVVGVVIYFVLNVGLVSATVTHQYSPNILIEKNRVMDDGRPLEKEYFYKQYRTTYDISSTAWLRSRATMNETVYSSQWPGNPRGVYGKRNDKWVPAKSVRLLNSPIPMETRVGTGYVYLGSFSYIGNIIKFPGGHFQFNWEYTDEVQSQWDDKSKIYTNNGAAIFK